MLDTGLLDKITTFPRLLDYLRDELDWPIEEEDFEDLTFDYTPAEFGLKLDGERGRIEIKQLRPLVSTQPWGIFFLNFPGKALPVTVLRRILGALTKRKRASANPAERAVWEKHDLLFISSFGKAGERQLSFAHFQDRSSVNDLPALRVLGWDGQNTVRRLSWTNSTLKDRLHWPDDINDLDGWRERWSGAFIEGKGESVATSKAMAQELARLARQIRSRANELLEAESDEGPLRKLHRAFKEALIHDLKEDDFADMYAQTVAYGLLSARISRETGTLVADDAALMAPPTNPFLQELLTSFLQAGGRKGGMDFDELGVNEIVEMLRQANMEAVLRDFDDRNPQEDPVIHFYELFLSEYDAKKRVQRGVFYTPRPVVSFIVRSVDEVLRVDFGLEEGLADTATWGEVVARNPTIAIPKGVKASDPFVRILDPATGTGTFLVEVINLIHERMLVKWRRQSRNAREIDELWNSYVHTHLLPRLYGFELMMAPYAIAHMKIGLKLAETGYRFGSKERARIYLTNALEEARDLDMQLAFISEALAHEAKAANEAKGAARFTVVVGNPPYATANEATNATKDKNGRPNFIGKLLESYYEIDGVKLAERNSKPLKADEIKFTRLADWTILQSGVGTFSFIAPHGYLDGLVHRGMRHHLRTHFDKVRIVDLKGNSNRPGAKNDENVFDIQQGVAVTICQRSPRPVEQAVRIFEITGPRETSEGKYEWLQTAALASIPWSEVASHANVWSAANVDQAVQGELLKFPSVSDIFQSYGNGFKTHRDDFALALSKSDMEARIRDFISRSLSNEEIAEKYGLSDTRDWQIAERRSTFRAEKGPYERLLQAVYRPFDFRFCHHSRYFMDWPRHEVMDNAIYNLSLITTRQTKDEWAVLATSRPIDHKSLAAYDTNYLFSLWIKPSATEESARLNLSRTYISRLARLTGLSFDGDSGVPDRTMLREKNHLEQHRKSSSVLSIGQRQGSTQHTFTARDAFDWIYAVLHSPTYRKRYEASLKSNFARVPLPKNVDLFRALTSLGNRLIALHLLDTVAAPELIDPATTRFAGSGTALIPLTGGKRGYPKFIDGRVYVNPDRWFEEVPQETWESYVGGYQPCERWLKERRGHTLNVEDVLHYRRMVHALTETRSLAAEIDKIIEVFGGWPDAFCGMDHKELNVPLNNSAQPLARSSSSAHSTPQPMEVTSGEVHFTPQEVDRDELICMVRQIASSRPSFEREEAIHALASALNYRQITSEIREEFESALRTAVRRQIIVHESGQMRLGGRAIDDYNREHLVDQFLASLPRSRWVERQDAIRGFARWMGFRRTGQKIDDFGRSLINGLLRRKRLEADGTVIRRI